MDNSFDEFGFFQVGMGDVAPFEFGAGQVVAVVGGVKRPFSAFSSVYQESLLSPYRRASLAALIIAQNGRCRA
jgi:hypothetical protein